MTKKQMEELSDMIVDKLMSRQREMDQEFIKELEQSSLAIEVHEKIPSNDRIALEINKLNKLLDDCIKAEDYEKAIEYTNKIQDLKERLNNKK